MLVDDYEPWRRFVASTLQKCSGLQVISESGDGLEAVETAREMQPDLILLDIGLPRQNGIEVARRIRECSPKSKILFVSETRSADIAEEALRSGGLGYVVKSDADKELLPAVDAILQGRRFVSATLANHFLVATTLSMVHTMHLSWLAMLTSGIC
jgi:DNA-binding NarL/FixJ family response regulator